MLRMTFGFDKNVAFSIRNLKVSSLLFIGVLMTCLLEYLRHLESIRCSALVSIKIYTFHILFTQKYT